MTHEEQDARVRFVHPDLPVDPVAVRAAAVALVREHVGWPLLDVSMDETLAVVACEPRGTGWLVRFEYVLDRDFASQYDRTLTTVADVILDATGASVAGRWPSKPGPG